MRISKMRRSFSSSSSALFVGAALAMGAVIGCSSAGDSGGGSGGSTAGSTGGSSSGGSSSGGSTATGGTSSSGGSASTGGRTGSGGTVASTGGTTTTGSGGVTGSGGTGTGSGGTATGGSAAGGSGPTGGKGGAMVGASGGATAGGGRGGSGMTASGGAGGMSTTDKVPAKPSSGCGKMSPAVGSSGSPLTVSGHKYYAKLPTGYDASKPYPLLFMFNPTNNPISWAEQNAGFETAPAKDAWIRVYPDPASEANGWGASDVSFFMPLYDQVTGAYCVDKARVFAAGESSGGDFSSILGCEHADVLRGVVPCSTKDVSAYPLDASKRKCTGEVTPLVMQGKNDNVVGPANGPKTRDFYAAVNHCGSMTTPVQGYTDTLSNCVQFQGCDANYPVYWCNHTDPNYSNTNHGWPTFAPKFVWAIFSAY